MIFAEQNSLLQFQATDSQKGPHLTGADPGFPVGGGDGSPTYAKTKEMDSVKGEGAPDPPMPKGIFTLSCMTGPL